MNLDARRMAKKVCKQLEPLLAVAIVARSKGSGGYSLVQGYRTALGLCAGGCIKFGMSEDEVLDTVGRAIAGFKSTQKGSRDAN